MISLTGSWLNFIARRCSRFSRVLRKAGGFPSAKALSLDGRASRPTRVYLDPFNQNEGYEKIFRFIDDRKFLDQRAENIKANFKPRDWNEVAKDMIGVINSLAGRPDFSRKPVGPPLLKASRMYRCGHSDDISQFIESGDASVVHLAFDTEWYPVENFGRWMRGRRAAVEFVVEQAIDEPILIMIETATVSWLHETQLQISINETNYPIVSLQPGSRRPLLLQAVPTTGKVLLEFCAVGEITPGTDARRAYSSALAPSVTPVPPIRYPGSCSWKNCCLVCGTLLRYSQYRCHNALWMILPHGIECCEADQ